MIQAVRLFNLKYPCFGQSLRNCTKYKTKLYMKATQLEEQEKLDQLVKKFAPRVIYNTIIEKKILKYEELHKKGKNRCNCEETDPIPITLKYFDKDISVEKEPILVKVDTNETKVVNFPYDSGGYSVENHKESLLPKPSLSENIAVRVAEEVQKRYEIQKEFKTWMSSYDNYNDVDMDDSDFEEWKINYGTPDPSAPTSQTPCGGCGAFLHCKDTSIPGYIPSEIFKNSRVYGGSNLDAIICQRCYFLKHHNVALQVQITPEDYPKVLKTISERGGLVVLLIDLLDFPCSIWPGIGEIFGSSTPIVIVGNKVDLLPQDSKDFLKRIKKTLLNYVKLQGFATFNIKDIALISAKTGYGVENLITKLNSLYQLKGEVYIVGCTNVGKSSLFNAFLQSDYCKIQALDLVQRATTSVWPGTTLNLLKFPIKRPLGYRQYLRQKRLELAQKIELEEQQLRKEQLRKTRHPKFASLIGRIDITRNPYTLPEQQLPEDAFVIKSRENESGITKMGINPRSPEFKQSKWCYDTPGVVQPDQIIHLLTTEELLLTLPKEIIIPRTFCIKPNSSVFIAGLARLDYLEGSGSVRLTIFSSKDLPITICELQEADELYQELLGTDLLKIPYGSSERISKWPKLQAEKEFVVTGINWKKSTKDVVLSSAGWIAITGMANLKYKFQPWTPEKRGIYIRDCLLPHAVGLCGKRFKKSVTYGKFKFFTK